MAGALAALRTAWHLVGWVLLLAIGAELAYRAQASLRATGDTEIGQRTDRPGASDPWRGDLEAEWARNNDARSAMRWASYTYWRRRPFAGRYINVDSNGIRRTPQPPRPAGACDVFMLGGSTMWGSNQRDSATIPAAVARALPAAGVASAFVTNFGESGYVSTQEMIALELALRAGRRPAVVVFLDGINDIDAAIMNGRAGIPQNESLREAEFSMGRALTPWAPSLRDDARAAGLLAGLALRRSLLLRRLVTAVRPQRPVAVPHGLGAEVARIYAANQELVEALAARYGFVPFYFWQPSIATTAKTLTAYERAAFASAPAGQQRARATVFAAALHADGAPMQRVGGARFVDITGLFDRERETVFVDHIGHTTEAANTTLADTIVAEIAPALRARNAGCGAAPPRRLPR